MTDSLFPALEVPADPKAGKGQDARRTVDQLQWIAKGRHPVTHLPLHPDAAADRTGPGLRCRDCGHLWRKLGRYQKCAQVLDTDSAGTDMRGWWPACTQHTPKDTQ